MPLGEFLVENYVKSSKGNNHLNSNDKTYGLWYVQHIGGLTCCPKRPAPGMQLRLQRSAAVSDVMARNGITAVDPISRERVSRALRYRSRPVSREGRRFLALDFEWLSTFWNAGRLPNPIGTIPLRPTSG